MSRFDIKNIKNIDVVDLKQRAKNLKRHKWCLITAGVIMGLLGIYSMFHPGKTILSLAVFIGCGFVISGINHIFADYAYESDSAVHPEWLMSQGVFEVILGFILLSNLGVTVLSVPLMVAFWTMFDGVMRMTASFRLKKAGIGKWRLLFVYGIISIIFSLILLSRPLPGIFASTFLIGLTLLVWGITAVFEAFNLYD